MQMIEINKLIPHPRNKEFFDDMYGERWEDFKKSIGRRGIVEAIVTTQDLVIVSGHQRVRAAKEIGLLTVPIIVKHYDEDENKEDMILEDLISTNIMQRGVGNVNPMKMAKCIMELERIKGIQHGGNRKSNQDNLDLITQKDLAKQLNISQQQLGDYKKLLNLIPELQNLVSTGAMSATTAYKIWAKMPQEEQEQFFNDIGRDKIKTLTQKATKDLIDQYNKEKEQLEQEKNTLKRQLILEKNKEPKIQTIDKTDYKTIEKLKQEINEMKSTLTRKQQENLAMRSQLEMYKSDSEEYEKMKNDIELLTSKKDDLGRQIDSITSISGLVVDINHLIKDKLAPIKYSKALLEAKNEDIVINNLSEIVNVVQSWCDEMKQYLPNEIEYVEVM